MLFRSSLSVSVFVNSFRRGASSSRDTGTSWPYSIVSGSGVGSSIMAGPPRKWIGIRLKVDVLELLRRGAAYHGIGYQTYLQWILEEGLRSEAHYYGWRTPSIRRTKERTPKSLQNEIQRLARLARRKAKRKDAPPKKAGPAPDDQGES